MTSVLASLHTPARDTHFLLFPCTLLFRRLSPASPWTPRLTAFARQAKALQQSLMEIVDRVEIVKSEHEKLEGGNKFLQS